MRKDELRKERTERHGQALAIVEQRMREASSQSEACKRTGDDTRMYQLNLVWHWLDAVRRDIENLAK